MNGFAELESLNIFSGLFLERRELLQDFFVGSGFSGRGFGRDCGIAVLLHDEPGRVPDLVAELPAGHDGRFVPLDVLAARLPDEGEARRVRSVLIDVIEGIDARAEAL